jgi:hypothetical protein
MVDIATVSVVSSGLVALGTIVTNSIGGERQRSHETDLDFEKRVWERKSEALFGVIHECRTMLDTLDREELNDDDHNRLWWALHLSRRLDALHDVRSTVEALASSECRSALTSLVEAMTEQGVEQYVGRRVDSYRTQMSEDDPPETSGDALVARLDPRMQKIRRHQRYREWINEAEQEALADFNPNLPDLQSRAHRLLEAARESVRRPKD